MPREGAGGGVGGHVLGQGHRLPVSAPSADTYLPTSDVEEILKGTGNTARRRASLIAQPLPRRSATAEDAVTVRRAGRPLTAPTASEVAGAAGRAARRAARLPLPGAPSLTPSGPRSALLFVPPDPFLGAGFFARPTHTCLHPTASSSLTAGLPLGLLLLAVLVLLGAGYRHRVRLRRGLCQLTGPSCQYRYRPPWPQALTPRMHTSLPRGGDPSHLTSHPDPRRVAGGRSTSAQQPRVESMGAPPGSRAAPRLLTGPQLPSSCSAQACQRSAPLQGHVGRESVV